MQTYDVHVLAVQETKQKGVSIRNMENIVFFNSGGENRLFGTGFILTKEMGNKVVDFKAISDRMCWIRLRGKYRKISILNVHAPTEEKSEDVKEIFFDKIQKNFDSFPRYDFKLIVGDFNAKVGREETYKSWTGGKSKHQYCNDNGRGW